MATSIDKNSPELFHYTGIKGLEGIIKTQTLWATHAAFVNDTTEIRAFAERLPGILRAPIKHFVKYSAKQSLDNRLLISQHGGNKKAVEEITAGFITGMYKALLGSEQAEPYCEPYITSFCTASSKLIAQHGLLSQWRAYGQDGGYAIVFAKDKLDALLEEECKKWKYVLLSDNVIYSSDTEKKIRKVLGEDSNKVQESIDLFLRSNGSPEKLEELYDPFIRCACRYKHWGFHEEKEVRIVAMRPYKKLFEVQRSKGLVMEEKPKLHFIKAGLPVPYIALFEGITQLPKKPLPITRIIIGPHQDKEKRRVAVKSLLSQYGLDIDIPVSVSEIPYVEQTW